MPRIVYSVAMSVDGFIADQHGGIQWLHAYNSDELGAFFAAVGAVVLGRSTFEQLLAQGPWPYPGRTALVVSSRPMSGLPEAVRSVPVAGLASALGALRGATNGDIWIIGGGRTAAACLDIGLLDELELYIVPHLVGRGVPLFVNESIPTRLQLLATLNLPKGVVMLRYARLR
jgi:dihydrofolate reductase